MHLLSAVRHSCLHVLLASTGWYRHARVRIALRRIHRRNALCLDATRHSLLTHASMHRNMALLVPLILLQK